MAEILKAPRYYPEGAAQPFNDIELFPITEEEDGTAYPAEGEEPVFYYSLFAHLNTGGLTCLADLPTEAEAETVLHLLQSTALNFKPRHKKIK